jgi:predicted DsbA family dithiol-disulfide isomerase
MAQDISVTVVSDILCPWCYIGYKELVNAVDNVRKDHPDAKIDIEYRPFLLDPRLNCKEPVDKVRGMACYRVSLMTDVGMRMSVSCLYPSR